MKFTIPLTADNYTVFTPEATAGMVGQQHKNGTITAAELTNDGHTIILTLEVTESEAEEIHTGKQ